MPHAFLQYIKKNMISKLQKYLKYIELPWKEKLRLVQQAQMLPPNPSFTLKKAPFEEENFVFLSVFDTYKEENLYKLQTYRQNSKNGPPKAVLAFFHGLNNHMSRSGHIAQYLSTRGITTVGYDYRGFGKSEGTQGYIDSFNTHLNDCEKFLNLVRKVYPNTPLFVSGLSLGGLTAYHMSLKHPQWFKGAVFLAPALIPSIQNSKKLHTLINILDLVSIFLPNDIRLLKIQLEHLCRTPEVIEDLKKDPLFQHNRLRLKTVISILSAQESTPETFSRYNTPFLVVQGGRDKLTDPNVAFDLFTNSKTIQEDKDVLFYEDMWHVITHEPQIDEIQQKMADWILNRLKK